MPDTQAIERALLRFRVSELTTRYAPYYALLHDLDSTSSSLNDTVNTQYCPRGQTYHITFMSLGTYLNAERSAWTLPDSDSASDKANSAAPTTSAVYNAARALSLTNIQTSIIDALTAFPLRNTGSHKTLFDVLESRDYKALAQMLSQDLDELRNTESMIPRILDYHPEQKTLMVGVVEILRDEWFDFSPALRPDCWVARTEVLDGVRRVGRDGASRDPIAEVVERKAAWAGLAGRERAYF